MGTLIASVSPRHSIVVAMVVIVTALVTSLVSTIISIIPSIPVMVIPVVVLTVVLRVVLVRFPILGPTFKFPMARLLTEPTYHWIPITIFPWVITTATSALINYCSISIASKPVPIATIVVEIVVSISTAIPFELELIVPLILLKIILVLLVTTLILVPNIFPLLTNSIIPLLESIQMGSFPIQGIERSKSLSSKHHL
ncbi:uncharacterized protein [Spinacia oleracea]|uniref:ABC transmembrane type-1 domain-containing protein n=1 Tax=Spinacia oleracea TaxID=3562 RepID=A0ABM3RQJ6_SPIOL|nr:uncharacterized protein LOC130471665 [Spinacia oleracea]